MRGSLRLPSAGWTLAAVLLLPTTASCTALAERQEEERFTVSSTGVISDAVTGLFWRVGPDRDMGWSDANAWIDSLPGDWRMPFRYELASLYSAGIRYGDWGPFENGGWQVWSLDIRRGAERYSFSFVPHEAYWSYTFSDFTGERVFAVQSPPFRVLLSGT